MDAPIDAWCYPVHFCVVLARGWRVCVVLLLSILCGSCSVSLCEFLRAIEAEPRLLEVVAGHMQAVHGKKPGKAVRMGQVAVCNLPRKA